MSLDFGDLEDFARELDHQGAKVVLAQRQVVKKGALNVKKRLQDEAQGVAHAPGFPRSITFDVELQGDELVAEIGPEKGGSGSLALLYLETPRPAPASLSRCSPPTPRPRRCSTTSGRWLRTLAEDVVEPVAARIESVVGAALTARCQTRTCS